MVKDHLLASALQDTIVTHSQVLRNLWLAMLLTFPILILAMVVAAVQVTTVLRALHCHCLAMQATIVLQF